MYTSPIYMDRMKVAAVCLPKLVKRKANTFQKTRHKGHTNTLEKRCITKGREKMKSSLNAIKGSQIHSNNAKCEDTNGQDSKVPINPQKTFHSKKLLTFFRVKWRKHLFLCLSELETGPSDIIPGLLPCRFRHISLTFIILLHSDIHFPRRKKSLLSFYSH